MAPPAVRCVELVKEYHTQKVVRALDFVHLDVQEGEVFGLLGPNGAGKTTLVRILATLLSATLGRAEVGGYDVRTQEQEVRRILSPRARPPSMPVPWAMIANSSPP